MLLDIHRAFLAAGASIIETATYQLSHTLLRELAYDDAAIDGLFARAVALARAAIAEHRAARAAPGDAAREPPLLVAGSMGPYGATLGDGSEYSGTLHLNGVALAAFHLERLRAMERAAPDVFLFETIPTRAEALAIAEVAAESAADTPAWISLSSPDGRQTYDGADIGSLAAELDTYANVDAIGVNCIAPAAAVAALRNVARGTSKPILICANLGQHWDGARGLTGGGGADEFLNAAAELLALGARYIGGCCGVGPETIARLAARVNAANADVLHP